MPVPVPGWDDDDDEVPSAMLPVIPLPGADPHKSNDTPQAGMIIGVILGATVVLAAMITVSHTVGIIQYWSIVLLHLKVKSSSP